MFAWRSAALVYRTRRIGPKTFGPFGEIDTSSGGSASCDTQHFSQELLHFCHHPSSAFCWVVPQPSSAEMSTLCRIYIPFPTNRIHIREDANSHKVIQCKHLSRSICTAGDWTYQTGFCLWGSLFSTHFFLLVLVAQRMERLLVSVFHDHDSRVGNCTGLVLNTDLLLSTDSKFLFPLSMPLNPLRLVTTAPVSIFSFLASKFRTRSFWSTLLFTIIFNFWLLGIDIF